MYNLNACKSLVVQTKSTVKMIYFYLFTVAYRVLVGETPKFNDSFAHSFSGNK